MQASLGPLIYIANMKSSKFREVHMYNFRSLKWQFILTLCYLFSISTFKKDSLVILTR